MKSVVEMGKISTSETRPRKRKRLRVSPNVYAILSILTFFGGLLSLVIGCFCVIMHAVVHDDHIFDQMGTGLLIAGIPLILISSFFIDKLGDSRS